jgi:replicative DNA helicase
MRNEPTRRTDEPEAKFFERCDNWKRQLERVRNTADVIIAKQRHGPVGTVMLTFQGEITRFSDYVGRDRLPVQH